MNDKRMLDTNIKGDNLRDIATKWLECDILLSALKLQLNSNVQFRTIIYMKGMNPLSYELYISHIVVFLDGFGIQEIWMLISY